MNIHLNSILPDDISDETAYHMVEFFSELTVIVEDYYVESRRRYIR